MKKRKNVDWHSATADAIWIDLEEYQDLLEYRSEYVLSGGAHRIDLLLIRKCSDTVIPKAMCRDFREFNLFEIKGIHSTLTTDTYYRIIGYAGMLINETGKPDEYSPLNLTLNFVSRRYPKKLFDHLRQDLKKKIEKVAPGVYDVSGETFSTRILVTKELDAEEYLWLSSLTDNLSDAGRINRLTDQYKEHSDNEHYQNYINQLARANARKKEEKGGDSPMVLEGILELCGTSSEEIRKQADDYYLPLLKSKDDLLNEQQSQLNEQQSQLNEQKSQLNEQKSLIAQLKAEIEKLKKNQKK